MADKPQTNVHPIDPQDRDVARNSGIDFKPELFGRIRVNRSAVERRAASIGTRRTVKKQYQAAWLLRALTCIDLTTLAGDDTPGRVRRLCQKAKREGFLALQEDVDRIDDDFVKRGLQLVIDGSDQEFIRKCLIHDQSLRPSVLSIVNERYLLLKGREKTAPPKFGDSLRKGISS